MQRDDQQLQSASGRPIRRYLLLTALLALLVVGVAAVFIARNDDLGASPSSAAPNPESTSAPTTTRATSQRDEVIVRLQQIIDVRERAFRERNARLFDEVYSSDCPCLEAGRDAIAALRREKVQWKGRATSLEVINAQRINDRLWEAVAIFRSDPFRIETESGILVREVPAERLRYRFLLVRTSRENPWRLGDASLVEGS